MPTYSIGGTRRAGYFNGSSHANMNIDPTKFPTIATGEVHQIAPVKLEFTRGQQWAGIALAGLLFFAIFAR